MFSLTNQIFLVLLSFSESLTRGQAKCLSLNVEAYMITPTLIDLNPVELKHYHPFMISLDKCSVSCNVLSSKFGYQKETKDINVKVFKLIANKNGTHGKTSFIWL